MPLTPVSWKSRIHASRMLMAKMMGGMQTMYFFWNRGKYTINQPKIAPAKHE